MKKPSPNSSEPSKIERIAANWAIAIDRGLTPEEQDEYMQWLSEDARHREAISLYQWSWDELDRLAGLQATTSDPVDVDLLKPGNRYSRKFSMGRLLTFTPWHAAATLTAGLAAALAVAFWPTPSVQSLHDSEEAATLLTRIEQRTLEDGTVLEINRGAVLETVFTPEERRVRLLSGEANFDVAKDPSRPFVVDVGDVDIRAIGTAFNVRYTAELVDVIVTEGKVEVTASNIADQPADSVKEEPPVLEVGQRAIVTLDEKEPRMEVSSLTEAEQNEALLWQPRLLDFEEAALEQIVATFNRYNRSIELVLDDSSLKPLKLSSVFWSDNVEGFVRLMESSFGMDAEWHSDKKAIILRKAKR